MLQYSYTIISLNYYYCITFSFFVRSSVASTYTLQLKDNDNTRQIAATYTINSANTWEYKTVTFAGDTTGAFDNDNALSLQVLFWIDAGTTFTSGTLDTSWATQTNANRVNGTTGWLISSTPTFYITGIQLEVGDVATAFEHRSFSDELLRCQRYYFEIDFDAGEEPLGAFYASNRSVCTQAFHVQMRTDPTVTSTFGSGGLQADYSNEHCFRWYLNAQQVSVTSAKADAEL